MCTVFYEMLLEEQGAFWEQQTGTDVCDEERDGIESQELSFVSLVLTYVAWPINQSMIPST